MNIVLAKTQGNRKVLTAIGENNCCFFQIRYIGVVRSGFNGIAFNPLFSLVSISLSKVRSTPRPYDAATAELKKLLDKRDAVRSQELLKAVADSPLSYTEIIALIKSGVKSSDDEK